MKRLANLLIVFVLFGIVTVQAQPSDLPPSEPYDSPIELRTDRGSQDLTGIVEALARAVGLTAIVKDIPETRVNYDIGDPKPFRQVWEIVLTLNDLDYLLLDNDIVIVGPESEVLKLRNLDAQALARELAADEGDLIQEFYRIHANAEDLSVILERSLPDLHVETLPGAATLLVRGSATEHERVGQLLARFDPPPTPQLIEIRTYRLSNARATDLAAVLRSTQVTLELPSTEADRADSEAGDTPQGGNGEFSVQADNRTNTLIVSAPPQVQDRIAELLTTLDSAEQQINVQVRIQEIQSRTAVDLGLNLAASAGQLSANLLDGGLRFLFDPHSAVSSFNIGAVLDTLETQGLSRRVDDSSLTVLNNSETSIQAGGTIFISIPGASENIERTIPYGV